MDFSRTVTSLSWSSRSESSCFRRDKIVSCISCSRTSSFFCDCCSRSYSLARNLSSLALNDLWARCSDALVSFHTCRREWFSFCFSDSSTSSPAILRWPCATLSASDFNFASRDPTRSSRTGLGAAEPTCSPSDRFFRDIGTPFFTSSSPFPAALAKRPVSSEKSREPVLGVWDVGGGGSSDLKIGINFCFSSIGNVSYAAWQRS
mmetsp:Transcript_21335/g.52224  ORF Transcript_21335/g.52224 Transcript_21335/m.52224 type:complete len:205 (-) Transcript_21335:1638-2252(-)